MNAITGSAFHRWERRGEGLAKGLGFLARNNELMFGMLIDLSTPRSMGLQKTFNRETLTRVKTTVLEVASHSHQYIGRSIFGPHSQLYLTLIYGDFLLVYSSNKGQGGPSD